MDKLCYSILILQRNFRQPKRERERDLRIVHSRIAFVEREHVFVPPQRRVRVLDRASVDLRLAVAGWTPLAAAADRFPGSDFFRNDIKYLENIEKNLEIVMSL